MKPSEILEKAAAHMERVGLHKGDAFKDWRKEDSPCCSIGAICCASDSIRQQDVAESFFHRFLGTDIGPWNDRPERTQAEVVAKLREAAEFARAEGK